jgi:hypothetical protein
VLVGGLLALHASMHVGLRYGWQQVPDFDATLACVHVHAGGMLGLAPSDAVKSLAARGGQRQPSTSSHQLD